MMARGEAKMPAGFRVELGVTTEFPVVDPPTLKHNKIDDRNRPKKSADRLFEQAADIMATQPLPPSKPEAEMTDAEVAVRLGQTQGIVDRELGIQVSRLLTAKSTSEAERALLRGVLRRIVQATKTAEMVADVFALVHSEGMPAEARLIAIDAAVRYWTVPAPCPGFCDAGHEHDDPTATSVLHRGVVGEVIDSIPDTGGRTGLVVAVERVDKNRVPGSAYVLLEEVDGSAEAGFFGGPKSVRKLTRLLGKARAVVRRDRQWVDRSEAHGTPLARAIMAMSDADLEAFGQGLGGGDAQAEAGA